MKASLFMLVLLVAGSAVAQTAPKNQTLKTDNSQTNRPNIVTLAPVTSQASAENKHPRITYSGPLVTAVKKKNPLELVDPWATPTETNGDTRVSYDLLTGRPNGVKLFTVRF